MADGAVFISYRRLDAPGYAGRLYDALAARLGDHRVFIDVGAIEPGALFKEQIDTAIGACDVLLAVIGPQWATVTDAQGRRRLDEPDDFVALEVGTALRREDVKVIPVLVDGARMPLADELPPALKTLGRRQAIELSAARWRYDVETLLAALDKALEVPTAPDVPEPAGTLRDEPVQPARSRRSLAWAGGAAAVVVMLGVAALLAWPRGGTSPSSASGRSPPEGASIVVNDAKPPKPGDKVAAAAETTVDGNHYRLVLSTADDNGAKRARIPLYMNLYAGQPLKLLQRREMPYPWYRDSVVASLKVDAGRPPNPEKTADVAFSWYPHIGDKTDLTHYFGVAYHGIDIY
jgi:hypothetical protein